jgi:hypothetical protein
MNRSTPTAGQTRARQTNANLAPLFPLGQLVATPAALHHLDLAGQDPQALVHRHVTGDFGQLCKEDIGMNRHAIQQGLRIVSAYEIAGQKFYCITEADRSSTCLLLAREY